MLLLRLPARPSQQPPPPPSTCSIACAFGFWYPALLIMFGGPGIYFTRLTRKIAPRLANVVSSHCCLRASLCCPPYSSSRFAPQFLWLMLSIGLGILTVMYTRELHARYGHEWETPAGSALPDFGIPLHPSSDWSVLDWAHYILVPRSWMQMWHLWGAAQNSAGA